MADDEKLEKLVDKYGLSEAELAAVVDRVKNPSTGQPNVHRHEWGGKRTRIGVVSDIHMGSLYVNQGALDDIMKRFKKHRVDAVYNPGDMTEGYNMRPGHTLEVELHGADAQVQGVVDRVPDIGVPHYFITGNHDHAHWKNAGVDVGRWIDKERDDMHYLGRDNAVIELSDDISLQLLHPSGGSAYAVSYKPQKIVESLSGGSKPDILAIGHFHKAEYLFYRNVHIVQAGTMQAQTPFMQTKGLSAHVAGWMLDIHAKNNGTIDRVDLKFFPYYE